MHRSSLALYIISSILVVLQLKYKVLTDTGVTMDITLTDSFRKMALRSIEVNVGRAAENQVVLDDPKVSPYHAQMCQGFSEYPKVPKERKRSHFLRE